MPDENPIPGLKALMAATRAVHDAIYRVSGMKKEVDSLEAHLADAKDRLTECQSKFKEAVIVWENAVGEFKSVLIGRTNEAATAKPMHPDMNAAAQQPPHYFAHFPHTTQDAAIAPGETLHSISQADAVPIEAPAPGNAPLPLVQPPPNWGAPSDPDSNAPFPQMPAQRPSAKKPWAGM